MTVLEGTCTKRVPSRPHPAKFSEPILAAFASLLPQGAHVFDPFAGVGRLASIPHITTTLVEIEPEWATDLVANALALPFADRTFRWGATSPCYGNRMADHHNNQDPCKKCSGIGFMDVFEEPCKACGGDGKSKRHTYRHYLDRMPHVESSAILQWGEAYRAFHRRAWAELTRVMTPDASFLLNISDHIRKGEVVPVTEFHHGVLVDLGWFCTKEIPIATRRQKHGQNGEARLTHESVLLFERIAA